MSGHRHDDAVAAPAPESVTDPVCGMTVDPATSPHRAEHDGHAFHFCSAGCRSKFIADPRRYLAPIPPAAPAMGAAVASGTIYTCPMHSEVRQNAPGNCPICGMFLVPVTEPAPDQAQSDTQSDTHEGRGSHDA